MLKLSSAPDSTYTCVHSALAALSLCAHQCQSSYSHIPSLVCKCVFCVSISSGDTRPRLLTFIPCAPGRDSAAPGSSAMLNTL